MKAPASAATVRATVLERQPTGRVVAHRQSGRWLRRRAECRDPPIQPLSNFLGNVNAVHMRLPIPLKEIQKNPNLEQSPEY
jgi:hypothetical protein